MSTFARMAQLLEKALQHGMALLAHEQSKVACGGASSAQPPPQGAACQEQVQPAQKDHQPPAGDKAAKRPRTDKGQRKHGGRSSLDQEPFIPQAPPAPRPSRAANCMAPGARRAWLRARPQPSCPAIADKPDSRAPPQHRLKATAEPPAKGRSSAREEGLPDHKKSKADKQAGPKIKVKTEPREEIVVPAAVAFGGKLLEPTQEEPDYGGSDSTDSSDSSRASRRRRSTKAARRAHEARKR